MNNDNTHNGVIYEMFSVTRFLVNKFERGYFSRKELTVGYIMATKKSYYSFEKDFLYTISAFEIIIKEKKSYIINWKKIEELYKQYPDEVSDAFLVETEKKSYLLKLLKERGVSIK